MAKNIFTDRAEAQDAAEKREKHKAKSLAHMHWGVEEQDDGTYKIALIKHSQSPQEIRAEAEARREEEREFRRHLDTPLADDGLTLRKIGITSAIFGAEATAMALHLRAMRLNSEKDNSKDSDGDSIT